MDRRAWRALQSRLDAITVREGSDTRLLDALDLDDPADLALAEGFAAHVEHLDEGDGCPECSTVALRLHRRLQGRPEPRPPDPLDVELAALVAAEPRPRRRVDLAEALRENLERESFKRELTDHRPW